MTTLDIHAAGSGVASSRRRRRGIAMSAHEKLVVPGTGRDPDPAAVPVHLLDLFVAQQTDRPLRRDPDLAVAAAALALPGRVPPAGHSTPGQFPAGLRAGAGTAQASGRLAAGEGPRPAPVEPAPAEAVEGVQLMRSMAGEPDVVAEGAPFNGDNRHPQMV